MGNCLISPARDDSAIDSDIDSTSTKGTSLTGEYKKYKLIAKTPYNHDSIIFRFELESPTTKLGLPIGNHLMLKYDDDTLDTEIMRAYTPITNDSDVGYFDLLIKIYSDGEMTSKLNALDVNQYVQCKGPKGSVHYHQTSQLKISMGVDNFNYLNCKKIGMLAGGSGITPMFQILRYIDQNKGSDQTQVSLVFSNKTKKDILLYKELQQISENNENVKIFYTVTKADDDGKEDENEEWNGGVGYIDREVVESHIAPPADDVVVMYCGPAGFEKTMKKLLNEIGYPKSNMLRF